MLRLRKRDLAGVGPRSAHIAGLPYACFSPSAALHGLRLATRAPRYGDPEDYAVLEAEGRAVALTTTCAANFLGLVPDGDHARGDRESARAAFEIAGDALRRDPEEVARAMLDLAAEPIELVIEQVADQYRIEEIELVGGGGGAGVLVPYIAKRNSLALACAFSSSA